MNSREQSWQFLCAGGLAALLLAAIAIFALRGEVPREEAAIACVGDVVLQVSFSVACLWAVRSSSLVTSIQTFVDHGSPSLQSLGTIAPWLTLLQIVLGAALRYKLMGAISHVVGAMLVGAFLLYFATGIMAPAPKGHPARTAAVVLLWVVLVQVVLGIAAYVVRFGQGSESTLPGTRLFSIGHIITGALTLGSVYAMSHLVQISSTKQEASGLPSTGTV